jgi:hypothetical protein
MSCPFDLRHYRELLEAAKAGGYRFERFGEEPRAGDLFLRHDVDLSLPAAVEMADLEAELDVMATYLLMTESVFYNLASEEGAEAIHRLRELGHAVGLHAVHHPDGSGVGLDGRFDPVVSWHNPRPEYMSDEIPGAANAYSNRYFAPPETYRSDSNQHWRSGCPHEELRAGSFPWLQILVHPEIWVYDGETMRETMRSMLEAEGARRLEQLAADGIDLT